MHELEKTKKMMNQETFMKQWVLKAKEQVMKLRKNDREKEMTMLVFQWKIEVIKTTIGRKGKIYECGPYYVCSPSCH